MPLLLIPLLAGGTGLLGGFFVSSGVSRISNLLKWASILLLMYYIWKYDLIKKLTK